MCCSCSPVVFVEAVLTIARTGARPVPKSTYLSLSLFCSCLLFFPLSLPPSSLLVPLHSERALDSSKERRIVDHRYGGREARKWPTIGRRVLFAGKESRRTFCVSCTSQQDSPWKISLRPVEIYVHRDGEVRVVNARYGIATFDRDTRIQ